MIKFINIFSKKIVLFVFGAFTLLYVIGNIFFTVCMENELISNLVSFNNGITIVNILFLFVLLFLTYYLIKKDFFHIKDKYLLSIFLLVSFVAGIAWIFVNDIELREIDDAYNCFRAAKNIAIGNLAPLSYKSYISVYPNNMGLVTYLFIHIKLFGVEKALYSIRIVNLIFVLIGYFALYRITNNIFNNRLINCVLVLLMFGSMQFVFYSFFVYGNCLSYTMALLSVMFLLDYFKNTKIFNLIFSSLFIICSISIKENSLIILIAEAILLILYVINTKKIVVLFVLLLTLLGTYGGTSGLQKFWGNRADIDYGDTKLPTICWFAYGLNYDQRRPGGYFNEFEVYHVENGYMPEFTEKRAQTFIDGVLENFKEKPNVALRFYSQKFLSSWANPQYETFDQFRELNNSDFVKNVVGGKINDVLNIFWDGVSSVIALGLFAFMIKKRKCLNLYSMIGMIIVIGGFLFHTLWEVKAIYLYQYFMYLLPYAACGLVSLFDKKDNHVV